MLKCDSPGSTSEASCSVAVPRIESGLVIGAEDIGSEAG